MQKTLLIYESKYGTTEKIARYLQMVLGPAKCCRTDEFKDFHKDFDFVIIGSPVYSGKLEPKIYQFVENNIDWLKEKPVAIFCTCLNPSDGDENLNDLAKIIGEIVDKNVLGGVLKQITLNEEDKKALQLFSERAGFKLEDIDNFNLENVLKYALELKLIKDDMMPKAPSPKVKESIEKFLTFHNTCTLSTSYKNRVRSTPIEYIYNNGFMYLLSEGGEKFSNIPLNKKVSMAVYDDYTGMNSLAGMQITGSAYILPEDTDEYYDVIKMNGLNKNFIKNIPFNMNIIKIELEKIEFLYSKFKEMDFEPKQIYFFPKRF